MSNSLHLSPFSSMLLPWGSIYPVHRHELIWRTKLFFWPRKGNQEAEKPGNPTLVTCLCRAWVSGSERAGLEKYWLLFFSTTLFTFASFIEGFPGLIGLGNGPAVAKSPAWREVPEQNKSLKTSDGLEWLMFGDSCVWRFTDLLRSTPSQSPSSSQWVSNSSERFMAVWGRRFFRCSRWMSGQSPLGYKWNPDHHLLQAHPFYGWLHSRQGSSWASISTGC